MSTQQLDFTAFIDDRARDFTGRAWVFAEIDRWLDDPGEQPFLIIAGEPGSGKSAIAARLTQTHDLAAHHFCIARQTETIDPLTFVRSVSLQLAGRCQPFARALGQAGNTQTNIQVSQTVEQVASGGQVTGVVIHNLMLGNIRAQEAFVQTVLTPLKAVAGDLCQPLVILVDALDEGAQYLGSETIVDLLANAGGLAGQVRFLVTSRPENAVLRHFEGHSATLLLDRNQNENQADIKAYIRQQVNRVADLHARLAEQAMPVETFVDLVATRSGGNFLYVRWLLPAIASGSQQFDNLTALPSGLDEIYREFLRTRSLGKDQRQWRGYRPLLGALAASRTPLRSEQLEHLTGQDEQTVSDFVLDVGQFLDPGLAAAGRYALYHQSVADWLGDKTRAKEFWIDLSTTHRRIAEHYWNLGQADWSKLAKTDEGYGLHFLATHLYQAGQFDRLAALIDQPWMHARFDGSGYTYDGFLADLDLAWRHAHEEALRQIDAGEEPAALAQCVRYALIRSSINSLAANYVPELVARAVEIGLWPIERALSLAARVPEPKLRLRMYLTFLKLEALTAAQRQVALEEGLAAAQSISSGFDQTQAVASLAEHLTGEARERALEQGLKAAQAINDASERARAMTALTEHLTGEAREQALEHAMKAAQAISYEFYRAQALASLAKHLTGEAREQALEQGLEAAQAISGGYYQARALASLAEHLAGEAREQALERGLEAARDISGEYAWDAEYRVSAFTALALHLTGEPREQALAEGMNSARALSNKYDRVRYMASLVPYLTGAAREQVLLEALAASFAAGDARTVAALAPHLVGTAREQALAEGLKNARAIRDEAHRARSLVALVPYLTEAAREQALSEALSASLAKGDAKTLAALALHLAGAAREQALAKGLAASLATGDTKAMAALAPHVSAEACERALAAALAVNDERYRATSLANLLPQLSGEAQSLAMTEALSALRAIGDEQEQAHTLSILAPHMNDKALAEGLSFVLTIRTEWRQARTLAAFAPQLTDELLVRGLRAVLKIRSDESRALALIAFAPQLKDELLSVALADAHAMRDSGPRAIALWALTAQLAVKYPAEPLTTARAAVQAIGNTPLLAQAVASLASQLTGQAREQVLTDALEAIAGIRDEMSRGMALADLAPALTDELLMVGLTMARRISNVSGRTTALGGFALSSSGETRSQALAEFLAMLQSGGFDERARARGLGDVAPHLTDDMRVEGLKMAEALSSAGFRAQARAGFVRSFSDDMSLLKQVWFDMITHLFQNPASLDRSMVLEFIAMKRLFVPPVVSTATTSQLASHIIEICRHWQWR